jgi:hypothetical protein
MSESDDFTHLDDPAFIAERRRVREVLERTPEHEVSPELMARYQQLTAEFLRRRQSLAFPPRPRACWPWKSCWPNQKRSAMTCSNRVFTF